VRTRLIDDLVTDAICAGARQLVLLGAGFDSRAWRLQKAQKIEVFEVDHPVTQRAKRERLNSSTGQLPSVQFVPVDFEQDDVWARLTDAGFDPGSPSVVVWEGVISYLTKPAVEKNMDLLARLLAPASRLIFTYMDKGAIDGSKTFPGARRWRSWVRFSGEPFIFGFDPKTLGETLSSFGFLLRSDESTRDIARRYCEPMGRREPGSQAYRVVRADRAKG
jgi:methyltransferase (TIGR00027 family)